MKVKILVELEIQSCDSDELPEDDMRKSAVKAVRGALQMAEAHGFDHPLDEVTAIEIETVEEAPPAAS
jgi:hypothetical protein